MTMGNLRVVRVLIDQDLRQLHSIRRRTRCDPGECWVFVNRARTMAKIGTAGGVVLHYWHRRGYEIDTGSIKRKLGAMRLALLVPLVLRDKIDDADDGRERRAA